MQGPDPGEETDPQQPEARREPSEHTRRVCFHRHSLHRPIHRAGSWRNDATTYENGNKDAKTYLSPRHFQTRSTTTFFTLSLTGMRMPNIQTDRYIREFDQNGQLDCDDRRHGDELRHKPRQLPRPHHPEWRKHPKHPQFQRQRRQRQRHQRERRQRRRQPLGKIEKYQTKRKQVTLTNGNHRHWLRNTQRREPTDTNTRNPLNRSKIDQNFLTFSLETFLVCKIIIGVISQKDYAYLRLRPCSYEHKEDEWAPCVELELPQQSPDQPVKNEKL